MSRSLSEMFRKIYYRQQMKSPHIFLSPLSPLRNSCTQHDGFSTVLHKKHKTLMKKVFFLKVFETIFLLQGEN